MKRLPIVLAVCALLALPIVYVSGAQDQVDDILGRYFRVTGGLDEIRQVRNISATARIESFDYQYDMHLLNDGRFCIEAPDRTTVHDGEAYWQSFHGLVQKLEGDALDDYRDTSLMRVFFHGFLDTEGRVVELAYGGQAVVHGQTYDLLTFITEDGKRQEHYVNVETGLVDRMIEFVPDPDLRELKNIHTYSDYEDIGPLRLPTLFQAKCLTNGEDVQPLTKLTELKVNEDLASGLFEKPERSAPVVRKDDDGLLAQVVAISGGGSLITNITQDDLAGLNPSDGDTLVAEVHGRRTRLGYMRAIEDFGNVGSGDYLATFNSTPALWLVKAYVGMTSDDSTYAVGTPVRLARSAETD